MPPSSRRKPPRVGDDGRDRGPGRGSGERRWLRVFGVNAAVLAGLLLLLGAAAEIHLRSIGFRHGFFPTEFVPEVGLMLAPDSELTWTNGREATVSRTNRWGFLDREPLSPARAAGCRVAVVGDSYVEAREVAIEDKFPAVLERLAGEALPRRGLTVSAFGRSNTGQVHQLAFYDRYARRLSPKLVILVFHLNDFADNERTLYALDQAFDPERLPFVTAERGEDGEVRLRPPHPDALASRWAPALGVSASAFRQLRAFVFRLREVSFAADWVYGRAVAGFRDRLDAGRAARLAEVDAGPGPAPAGEWRPGAEYLPRVVARRIGRAFAAGGEEWEARLPPLYREAVAMTGFALDEFQRRARRDGARLWLLVTHWTTRQAGPEAVEAIRSLAEERGIPVLNQYAAILRAGGDPREASIPRNGHWNRAGHRWAAESVLARLRVSPETCRPDAAAERASGSSGDAR